MKTAISYRNISELARPDLKGLIGNLLGRHLQPHLSHFPAELVRLRATLERSGHRRLYRARLRLGFPSATLACSDESPELGKALELSFAELERQLERHIAHLRHEDNWRRKERRAGLLRLKDTATGPASAGLALFSDLVRPLLPELKRFVERELAYLQARGDLATGDPAVDEVVDETLARACERLAQRRRKLEPRQWLYQIALDVLAEEVSRRQTDEGRWISLEGGPPVQLREPHEDDDESMEVNDEDPQDATLGPRPCRRAARRGAAGNLSGQRRHACTLASEAGAPRTRRASRRANRTSVAPGQGI